MTSGSPPPLFRPIVSAERRTVLVVDDQPDERIIQRTMLSHLGYEVREASDGVAALEAVRERSPDLVLLDVAMPRLDGFEVCRRLKDDPATARVPVLLFTASVAGDVRERAREAGADGLLTKPMEPRAVATEIDRFLGGTSSE